MAINLSDYPHAGIFIDEINNSVIDRPAPQEAIVNFIPGVSKKGTVFNRPVLIKQSTDRNKYFGDIDRALEKKGSYFHRSIDIALQTGPVWAMNLLKTNSLDTLNYKSVSISAQYDNDVVLNELYDSYFNKAGFWQRDTESFLFFAQNADRMIHLTNMSDKPVSIFMFKSPAAGFNVTAELWYKGQDKVPTWMNKNDLISDYMVRVVIVRGDWTNYTVLAADPTWSKYFSTSGIRKTKVDAFVRDAGVTLLAQYDGSLIPYFKDANGRNIFIESLINTDTDVTGVFCAYDIDKVETDLPNGKVDIIGQTLVDLDKGTINFMSYQDTINEVDNYAQQELDVLSNVIGIGSLVGRTTDNTNGTLTDLTVTTTTGALGALTTDTPNITITDGGSGSVIINNTLIAIPTTSLTLTSVNVPVSLSNYRIDAIYIDQNGVINVLEGTVVNFTSGQVTPGAVTGLSFPAGYPNNAIVLGYVLRERTSASASSGIYFAIALDNVGFIPLTIGSALTDLLVQNTANNTLHVVFDNTATATKAKYAEYRRLQFFNEIVTKKSLANSIIIDSLGNKVSLVGSIWTDNYTSGTGNKFFSLTVGASFNIKQLSYTNNVLMFYYNDNEFGLNATYTGSGNLAGLETRTSITGTADYGVVSKLSNFYSDYTNGRINTGDFFYIRKILATDSDIKFVHYANLANPNSIGDYIIISNANATALGLVASNTGLSNSFHGLIESHPVNAGDFLFQTGYNYNAGAVSTDVQYGLQQDGYLTSGYKLFSVNNLVTTYTTSTPTDIYDFDAKLYLKMYFISSTLKVDFMADNSLTTPGMIPSADIANNLDLNIYSGEAAYTQTLEIEQHSSYTLTDTKFLIDAVRYPEVKVGDYVKAYVGTLQPGEYPKKFARIIKKQPWSGNTVNNVNYQEINVDIKVHIEDFGGDLQTTRYTTIEDYIDTYKAIELNGFVTQATSWPDGTETRQNDILNIIEKESSLYYAIVNKQKFNFRYLIDSFGLGLTEFSKQQLADITGKRKTCIAFLNMPSVKALKASTNPSFINTTDGTLNTEYLKLGGDPNSNPAFLYSFAQGSGRDDGRDTIGYFFPYVTVNDNGRPLDFPPAVYAMNTYMRKNNSTIAGVYNWTVAAGINDGKILGISGTEMDFTELDYTNLYAMGANPISYAKNTGYYLETEWTASLAPLSSLSYLHVREVLIDLENDLYAMLMKYQWKFNTVSIRAKIKREADTICQKYVDKSGLYAYQNIINEINNTPTLIDNQFGLLETKIEAVKAMGIIVNQIGVMATGALGSSTGFGV